MKKISFEKAEISHKNLIFEWLENPHVKEFWDNSLNHRKDIILFMNGREKKSPYFNGEHDYHYWIGSINNDPFCMMMTSELIKSKCIEEDSPFVPYLSQKGKTIGLDFMIGNKNYLGKGLGAITIEIFIKFYRSTIDSKCDTFMIDPGMHNPRAKHVYAKAGFEVVGKYTTEQGYFNGNQSFIMIKKMANE